METISQMPSKSQPRIKFNEPKNVIAYSMMMKKLINFLDISIESHFDNISSDNI